VEFLPDSGHVWLRIRRDDDETSTPEPQPGIQGKGGVGCPEGEKTLVELAQQFNVHVNQITQWKAQLLQGAAGVFGSEAKAGSMGPTVDLKALHAKIGELTLEEMIFWKAALGKAGMLSAKR